MKTFDDIIGYEEEKEELKRLADILKNSEKYLKIGIKLPQAIMLNGEPGVGKTLMAEALINESGRKYYYCRKDRSDNDFTEKIRETFSKAIENAPSIVFLDDMDKFAEDNLDSHNCNSKEFVAIQSCFEEIKEKDVFVIATVNGSRNIPHSLMRAGRFGRDMYIRSPSFDDSVKILNHYMKGKKVSDEITPDVLAYILNNGSCSDLETVINEAGIYAIYDGCDKIEKSHFIKAVFKTELWGFGRKNPNQEHRKVVAYHEAGHAALSLLSGYKIAYTTIRQSYNTYGVCKRLNDDDTMISYSSEKEKARIGLAGKAAVEVMLEMPDDVGTYDDIQHVTSSIKSLITQACVEGFEYNSHFHLKNNHLSDKIAKVMSEIYQDTVRLIAENKPLVEKIAEALLEKETLLKEDVDLIYDNYLKSTVEK